MDSDHHSGCERIVTEFQLREGVYRLASNRLDLRMGAAAVRLPTSSSGQYVGPAAMSQAGFQSNTSYGAGQHGPAANLSQLNSAVNTGPVEPVKISSQSYHLDGELYELLGINYGMYTFWYAYRGPSRVVELDLQCLDKRIYRGTVPTCHDICDVYHVESCDANSNEVYHLSLVGFSHGQIQLMDFRGPQNESRVFNEERAYETSKVSCLKWLPNSDFEFVVGHMSGAMYHYSAKEQSHSGCPVFVPVVQSDTFVIYQSRSTTQNNLGNKSSYPNQSSVGSNGTATSASSATPRNPLFKWLVGDGAVNDIQFAPHISNRLTNRKGAKLENRIAIATADGFVRIFDFESKEPQGRIKSYFGAMLCVAWSPDGRLIAAGAEDDLIHVYSTEESKVVLRCQGHKSWVSSLAFDCHFAPPHTVRDTVKTYSQRSAKWSHYRLGSVSHDTYFCLWEISDEILSSSFLRQLSGARTRSRNSSVYQNERTSPKNSESQQPTYSTPICPPVASPPSVNLARSNSLPGSKINNVSEKGSTRSEAGNSSNVVVNGSTGNHGNKKEKLPLSMFRSHSSNHSSGSSSKSHKFLHHINHQKLKVQEEAQAVFGTDVCPRNGEVPQIEPLCNAKASHERVTSIQFMAHCFVIGGKEGFVSIYSRPNLPPSPPRTSPRNSGSGDYENGSTHQFAQQVPMQYQKYPYASSIPSRGGHGSNHCLSAASPPGSGTGGPVPMSGDPVVAAAPNSSNPAAPYTYNRMCSSSSSQQLPPPAMQTQSKSSTKQQRMVSEKSII